MNETKWTPMPWVIDESQGEVVIAGGETESGNMAVIAVMGQYWDSEENDANAQLIVQSPALYEALEAALEWMESIPVEAGTLLPLAVNDALWLAFDKGRAVLAAARGTAE